MPNLGPEIQNIKLGEYCPVVKGFVYLYRKGQECWNLEAPVRELGQRSQDVIDCINSSRTRRGQIVTCVRALR